MSNELQIKPLLKYEVHYRSHGVDGTELHVDVFTADEVKVEGFITSFYRTGNLIRQYYTNLEKTIITPVDSDEEIPA
jgi:hypothetical protein